MATVRITESVTLDEAELEERFVRSSGPGGQNVNKVSTAVELRFDVRSSPSLPGEVRVRLERLAGRRLTDEGVLVIQAQSHRTQERNREDARERLFELIRQACVVPKRRIKTKAAARLERTPARIEGKAQPREKVARRQARFQLRPIAPRRRRPTTWVWPVGKRQSAIIFGGVDENQVAVIPCNNRFA